MADKSIVKIIKSIGKSQQINNIDDATVHRVNLDGTFDIQLSSGAIKRRALNMRTDIDFRVGDVVNVSFVGNHKETAKIIGRSVKRKGEKKIIVV